MFSATHFLKRLSCLNSPGTPQQLFAALRRQPNSTEKSVNATISCAEQRPFKTPQLPALRAVVSEPAQQKRRFFLLLFLSSPGSLPETWKSADESGSNRCGETSCHLVIWRGRKRRVWGVLTFRYTAPARAGNGGRGHGCCPVPIRPTQWLTRPNGAVLSPPAGRRSSLCQQHRDPGIEWTCISSLCPSASRPSKVGPGCRPELQPAYSRTRCLPHPRVGKTVSPAVCCRRSQLIYRTAARRSNFIFPAYSFTL